MIFRVFMMMGVVATMAAFPAWAGDDDINVKSKLKGCQANKPGRTQITVNLEMAEEPVYDLSRDIAWMNRDGGKSAAEWLEKNGLTSVYTPNQLEKQALANGGMLLNRRWRMISRSYGPYGGYQCPYFARVEINMFYRTLIQIPKEYAIGSCEFKVLQAHELRHHQTNMQVMRDIGKRMEVDLPRIVQEMEGDKYLPHDKIRPYFEQMEAGFDDFIKVYYTDLVRKEMDKRNDLVDTPEEYKHTTDQLRACAGKR